MQFQLCHQQLKDLIICLLRDACRTSRILAQLSHPPNRLLLIYGTLVMEQPQPLAQPAHNYNKEGSYQVSLSIETVNGCRDTLVFPAAVVVTNKPKAAFVAAPVTACAYQSVFFTNASTGGVNNQFWYFGDNTYSELPNPSHHYTDTGYFTITLVAGNLFCYDTLVVEKHDLY